MRLQLETNTPNFTCNLQKIVIFVQEMASNRFQPGGAFMTIASSVKS